MLNSDLLVGLLVLILYYLVFPIQLVLIKTFGDISSLDFDYTLFKEFFLVAIHAFFILNLLKKLSVFAFIFNFSILQAVFLILGLYGYIQPHNLNYLPLVSIFLVSFQIMFLNAARIYQLKNVRAFRVSHLDYIIISLQINPFCVILLIIILAHYVCSW